MLDNRANRLIKPLMQRLAKRLQRLGCTPDQLTITGFISGLLAIVSISFGCYLLGLLWVLINRLLDGLDGALARETQTSDAGGYLDIVLDFIFYAGIVFAFVLSNPASNAIPGSLLLFCFMGTGSSFLAFAIMAERHQIADGSHVNKAMHYVQGITEGTETIIFFVLCLLFPAYFPALAYLFALLCAITTATRVIDGYRLLREIDQRTE